MHQMTIQLFRYVQYNRGVRYYKLMYEAVTRRVFEKMKTDSVGMYDDYFEDIQSSQTLTKKYTEFLDLRERLEKGLNFGWVSLKCQKSS